MSKTKILSSLLYSKSVSKTTLTLPPPLLNTETSSLFRGKSFPYISSKHGSRCGKNVYVFWLSWSTPLNTLHGKRSLSLCTSMDGRSVVVPFNRDKFGRLGFSCRLMIQVFIFCSLMRLLFKCFEDMFLPCWIINSVDWNVTSAISFPVFILLFQFLYNIIVF